MGNVDESIITYAKTCKNGELTTEGFKASVEGMTLSAQAATVATKALAVAGDMLVGWAISEAISLAVTALDNYIHRVEKANEATEEAIQTYESLTSEVESLESQIKELNDQIKELNPITDADDIENLKAETAELDTQLKILQEKQRLASIDADEKAQESLSMTERSKYKKTSEYNNFSTVAYVTKDEELLSAIEAYKEYEAKVNSANEALAKMAETGDYSQREWNAQEKIVSEYSQKMEEARLYANGLAVTINEQVVALNGDTEASKALKDANE